MNETAKLADLDGFIFFSDALISTWLTGIQ